MTAIPENVGKSPASDELSHRTNVADLPGIDPGTIRRSELRVSGNPLGVSNTSNQSGADSIAMTGATPDELMPAAETARLFRRTLRTLSNWEKDGVLMPVRIRRQRYYRLRDVEALLSGSDKGGRGAGH